MEQNLAIRETAADPFSDEWKIEYAGTLLAGSALDWWSQLSATPTVLHGDESQPQVNTANNPRVTRRLFETHPEILDTGGSYVPDSRPATWDDFKAAMIARFDVINPADQARAVIINLRQKTTVAAYTQQFMAAVAYLPHMHIGDKKFQYLRGLSSEVYDRMTQQDLDSYTMGDMVRAAGRIDTRNYEDRRQRGDNWDRNQSQASTVPQVNAFDAEEDDSESEDPKPRLRPVTCFKCGKTGHVRRDCRSEGATGGRLERANGQ